MITKKTIENITGIAADNIEQVGSKQFFIVPKGNINLVYSYVTIIGYSLNGEKYIMTDRNYSNATQTHKKHFKHQLIPHVDFLTKLKELKVSR
jgi:hypothetical protein